MVRSAGFDDVPCNWVAPGGEPRAYRSSLNLFHMHGRHQAVQTGEIELRPLKLHKHRPVLAALLAMASAVTMVPRDAAAAVNGAVVVNAADPRVGGRLFAATSPFNQVIPVNPQLDPKSAD
ncbi:hypothetical protein ACWEOZ_34915, partial [Actinoplanes sp. NPDC004185]